MTDNLQDSEHVLNESSQDVHRDEGRDHERIVEVDGVINEATEEFREKKRQKKSTVWAEFKEITLPDGSKKGECVHCKNKLTINPSGPTTHFSRHLKSCLLRKVHQKQQQQITFQPSEMGEMQLVSALTDEKFDMSKMREAVAHWVLMHEHPFTIVEEEGFNMMQRRGMPQWENISRVTNKNDCVQVYEIEKKKLKALLKGINKISSTTDLWKSSNQKIEYMVLTGHFIDSRWRLQKRVLNFIHIPPPRCGVEIADNIYKCLKEWGIENKIFTISVDNASSNDAAIRILKDTFSWNKRLLCGGKLFHVRCCAHILNLMVQDGLSEIKHVIEDVHDSVSFINQNEARLNSFTDIVQQLQLPERKLILDCRTRWNSTYEMLSTAFKFKEVFPRLRDRESNYNCCPTHEDWEKVEKVCEILKVFNAATQIISGSDYPTSNLFLNEVFRVKVLLDKKAHDQSDFIRAMVGKIKAKFDKYWGECNLLMCIAAILDPRCKMRMIGFCFPQMYGEREARENITKVKEALYEVYEEYVCEYQSNNESITTQGSDLASNNVNTEVSGSGWLEFSQFVQSVETVQHEKSDLDNYLNEGCFICKGDCSNFNALEWWKANTLKYRVLSIMARDILSIPITTVASESTFNAGSRVIDTYRASLAPETVQVLLCGSDWCRNLHGVKKKNKKEKKVIEVNLKLS